MKKHVMAISYTPKIDAVFGGNCRQTIRKGRKVAEGDEILFHDWAGRPYRSKWNRRMRVTVTEAIPIIIDWDRGIKYDALEFIWYDWDSVHVDELAENDFIDPPTGTELRDVFRGLNSMPSFMTSQIIRW